MKKALLQLLYCIIAPYLILYIDIQSLCSRRKEIFTNVRDGLISVVSMILGVLAGLILLILELLPIAVLLAIFL